MRRSVIEPPSGRDYLKESRAILDVISMPFSLVSSHVLKKPISEKPEPVLLIPGFGGGDGVMSPFRKFLSNSGYDCYRWGMGTN